MNQEKIMCGVCGNTFYPRAGWNVVKCVVCGYRIDIGFELSKCKMKSIRKAGIYHDHKSFEKCF